MSDDIARLGLALDSRDFVDSGTKAVRTLDDIKAKAVGANGAVGVLETSFQRAAESLKQMAVFAGITVGVTELIRLADTAKALEGQLKIVTKSSDDLRSAQDALYASANRTRQSYEGTVEMFARLSRATKDQNLSQKELIQVTESVNKAIVISNVTTQQAKNGVIQFGQAMAAGRLQGQDLRAMLEDIPRLGQAIAAGLGISTGALKSLGEQGKLTTDLVIKALLNQSKTLDDEYQKMPLRVSQAVQLVENAFLKYVGDVDKASGISAILSSGLVVVAKNFTLVADAALVAGAVFAARSLAPMLASVATEAQFLATTTALSTESLGALNSVALGSREAFAMKAQATAADVVALQAETTATIAQLAAERELLVARQLSAREELAQAAARMKNAVAPASVAALGGAVVMQEEAGQMFALQARANAMRELELVGTALVANEAAQTAANATLAVSEIAATETTIAMTVATAALGVVARATDVAVSLLSKTIQLFGGAWGIAILAIISGIYYLIDSHAKAKAATEEHTRAMADQAKQAVNSLLLMNKVIDALDRQKKSLLANIAAFKEGGSPGLEFSQQNQEALTKAAAEWDKYKESSVNAKEKTLSFEEALKQGNKAAIDFVDRLTFLTVTQKKLEDQSAATKEILAAMWEAKGADQMAAAVTKGKVALDALNVTLAAETKWRALGINRTEEQRKALVNLAIVTESANNRSKAAQSIQDMEFEIAGQKRLTEAALDGESASKAVSAALASEQSQRQQGLGVTTAQRDRMKELNAELQREKDITDANTQIRTADIAASDEIRMADAALKGASSVKQLTNQLEVEAAVRKLGAGATDIQRKSIELETEARQKASDLKDFNTRSGSLDQELTDTMRMVDATKLGTEATRELNVQLALEAENRERATAMTPAELERRRDQLEQLSAAKQQLEYQQKTAEEAKTLMTNLLQDTQTAFTDMIQKMLTDGIRSFADFATSIKNMIIHVFAELASMKLIQSILSGSPGLASMLGIPAGGAGAGATTSGETAGLSGGLGLGSMVAGVAGIGLGSFGLGYGLSSAGSAGKSALAGAASGAALGAAIGSIVPVVGTAVGAVLGGVAGFVGGLFGHAKKAQQAADDMKKALDDWDTSKQQFIDSIADKSGLQKSLEDMAAKFKVLVDAGNKLGQSTTDITDAYTDAVARAKQAEIDSVKASINDAGGKGYLNSASDIIKQAAANAKDLALAGGDVSQAYELQKLQLQKLFGTMKDTELADLAKAFPELAEAIASFTRTISDEGQKIVDQLPIRQALLDGRDREALVMQQAIDKQAALKQAMDDGLNAQQLTQLANIIDGELAKALADFDAAAKKAADDLAKAASDFAESINERILRASGQGAAADNAAFAYGQQAEMGAASGQPLQQQAMLAVAQLFERGERTANAQIDAEIQSIQDGTTATINAMTAQRDVLNASLAVQQDTLNTAQTNLSNTQTLVASIKQSKDSLLIGDNSTLSPMDQYNLLTQQFEDAAAAARGGNQDQAAVAAQLGPQLVTMARSLFATGTPFGVMSDHVVDTLSGLEDQYGKQATVEEQQLAEAQKQTDLLTQEIKLLEDQMKQVQAASDAQVAALKALEASGKASIDAVIKELEQNRDAAIGPADKMLDKLAELQKTVDASGQTMVSTQTKSLQENKQAVIDSSANEIDAVSNGADMNTLAQLHETAVLEQQRLEYNTGMIAQINELAAIRGYGDSTVQALEAQRESHDKDLQDQIASLKDWKPIINVYVTVNVGGDPADDGTRSSTEPVTKPDPGNGPPGTGNPTNPRPFLDPGVTTPEVPTVPPTIDTGLQTIGSPSRTSVPQFANGGAFDPGYAWVGEQGRELVHFGSAGQVFSNRDLQSSFSQDDSGLITLLQEVSDTLKEIKSDARKNGQIHAESLEEISDTLDKVAELGVFADKNTGTGN